MEAELNYLVTLVAALTLILALAGFGGLHRRRG
jgi:hypothetical protein